MNTRAIINHYMAARRSGYTTHLIKSAPEGGVILASNQSHAEILRAMLHGERRKDVEVVVPSHTNFDGMYRDKIVLMDNYTLQKLLLQIHSEQERLYKENLEMKQKLDMMEKILK